MNLPEKGAEVSLEQIEQICQFYGLDDLWKEIQADPPPKPFKSDGCSLWVDSWQGANYYPFCFLHDLKYWAGKPENEDIGRLVADAELMIDVAKAGDPVMAQIMFQGVRLGGPSLFRQSFSWGFGRR